jgi:ABC-2 type transport system permease protein
VPLDLLSGWIHAVAKFNPSTAFIEAGRGLISGAHDHTALAFGCAAALLVLLIVWGLTSLRAAERAA